MSDQDYNTEVTYNRGHLLLHLGTSCANLRLIQHRLARDTEGERDRERERERDRKGKRDRQTERHRHTERHRKSDSKRERKTGLDRKARYKTTPTQIEDQVIFILYFSSSKVR